MSKVMCKFCKKNVEEKKAVVLTGPSYICFECAGKMGYPVPNNDKELSSKEKLFKETDKKKLIPKPKQIKAYLDQYVIGQEYAKKVLSVACYEHYKRVDMKDNTIQKSNILLVGPTGSGKTHLVKTIANYLDVPLAIVPATNLTEAGYIGDDVESVIARLLQLADGIVEKAERGIIFIDEIDKLTVSSSASKKQVGGKGVQQALLALLEGTVCRVKASSEFGMVHHTIPVDTTNILFICGGAFPEMESIIEKRISGNSQAIGFGVKTENIKYDAKNLLLLVKPEDLKEAGMIPEFIGRLPVIAPLEYIDVAALKRILTEPKDAILRQYQKLFDYDGIELKVEDEALDIIAEKAVERGTGARSLRAILEELLLDLRFELPSDDTIGEVIITKEFAEGIGGPIYRPRSGTGDENY